MELSTVRFVAQVSVYAAEVQRGRAIRLLTTRTVGTE